MDGKFTGVFHSVFHSASSDLYVLSVYFCTEEQQALAVGICQWSNLKKFKEKSLFS